MRLYFECELHTLYHGAHISNMCGFFLPCFALFRSVPKESIENWIELVLLLFLLFELLVRFHSGLKRDFGTEERK